MEEVIHQAELTPVEPRAKMAAATGKTNENPKDMTLMALLREDYIVHERMLFEQGFWAMCRCTGLGSKRMDVLPKVFRAPCTLLYRFMYKFVEWTCGITLPYTVKVGSARSGYGITAE